MSKKIICPVLTCILALGVSIPSMAANSTYNMKSYNTIAFSSEQGSIAIYSDDILLLASKIYTLPARAWDPQMYSN